jgi:hypothetical protein
MGSLVETEDEADSEQFISAQLRSRTTISLMSDGSLIRWTKGYEG